MGISNGDLFLHLNSDNYTLITFDKDFLNPNLKLKGGVIVIDIHPNRDEFVEPLLVNFLKLVSQNIVDCYGKVIILNKVFLDKYK